MVSGYPKSTQSPLEDEQDFALAWMSRREKWNAYKYGDF